MQWQIRTLLRDIKGWPLHASHWEEMLLLLMCSSRDFALLIAMHKITEAEGIPQEENNLQTTLFFY